MTIFYCRVCNTRVVVSNDTTDYNHDCNVSQIVALRQEDVPISISRTNPDGSTLTDMPGDVRFAGIGNKLWGKRAWIEGGNIETFTRRGNRAKTTRPRDRITYNDLKGVSKR